MDERNHVQYEVIPDHKPLPDRYFVEVWVAVDENDNPILELGKSRMLTIPVRSDDPRIQY